MRRLGKRTKVQKERVGGRFKFNSMAVFSLLDFFISCPGAVAKNEVGGGGNRGEVGMMVEGLKGEKGREMSYTTEDKYIPSFEEIGTNK